MSSPLQRLSRAEPRSRDHTEPRNQNPGIDIALRDLYQEVGGSFDVYQDLVQAFEEQTLALKTWAEESTLDMAWKNKVKDKLRSEREASKLFGVAERIGSRQEAVKAAINRAQRMVSTWERKHKIEHQIRTANKAIVCCDGVMDLAKRATKERHACWYLVQELKDMEYLLSWKRHAWIHGEETGDAAKPTDWNGKDPQHGKETGNANQDSSGFGMNGGDQNALGDHSSPQANERKEDNTTDQDDAW
ncbi:hypothetical protein B0T16DRAFT_488674 [Cercophora newfieldiana]|uniref:Uncharacterized protein n=1 Tax=Cercophora newfieldiana TaxID=92897 RepID=A0AA39YT96_9PEZI|nr:hypothetical protein B0T16DRAFT_488674 [Cercophora newfieldiana]